MTEFAGDSALAAVDLTVEDDARPDPARDVNQDEIADFADFRPAEP
jgi:hypothetical protein